jgi:hypothetical protein
MRVRVLLGSPILDRDGSHNRLINGRTRSVLVEGSIPSSNTSLGLSFGKRSIAQRLEYLPLKQRDEGSNPSRPTSLRLHFLMALSSNGKDTSFSTM